MLIQAAWRYYSTDSTRPYLDATWRHYEILLPPHRHVSCLTSAHQQDVWCTCLLAGLFWFTNQFVVFFLFSFLFCSPTSSFSSLFFNPYSPSVGGVLVFTLLFFFGFVYSACSVCGVVMRLMRTRFPLPPGNLTWRRCTPAAQQSRYNSGIFAHYLVVVTILMSRFSSPFIAEPSLYMFYSFDFKIYTLMFYFSVSSVK